MHLPQEDLLSASHLGFKLEEAHWYYLDFYRTGENITKLPKLNLLSFVEFVESHCAAQIPHIYHAIDTHGGSKSLVTDFLAYKARVPTCGAIIINKTLDAVLVVRGASNSRSTWGFPKGKISRDEEPLDCAVREVFEETGFDIRPMIIPEAYFQVESENSFVRLYFVPSGIDSRLGEAIFAPQTRCEIGDIQWHPINKLLSPSQPGVRYYNVQPFFNPLVNWINEFSSMKNGSKKRDRSKKNEKTPNNLIGLFSTDDKVSKNTISKSKPTLKNPHSSFEHVHVHTSSFESRVRSHLENLNCIPLDLSKVILAFSSAI